MNHKLLQIPKEVVKCTNLKHLNLLKNENVNWKQSSETLSKLNPKIGIYVSIYDLDSIPKQLQSKITGIEILKIALDKIPDNIIHQKQLNYLDFSCDSYDKNNFTIFPTELFRLTNLKYLNLKYCQIKSLPQEILKLKKLTKLNLSYNQLTSLPTEIGTLTHLKILDLYNRHLSN